MPKTPRQPGTPGKGAHHQIFSRGRELGKTRLVPKREGWHNVKEDAMGEALRYKFSFDLRLMAKPCDQRKGIGGEFATGNSPVTGDPADMAKEKTCLEYCCWNCLIHCSSLNSPKTHFLYLGEFY